MEHWFETEIHVRRRELLDAARASRIARLSESGRSSSIRAHAAAIAEVLSERLADLAALLRGAENA